MRGDAAPATNTFLGLPGTLRQQASWAYELALCQLEAGLPDKAAESFTSAITLMPDLAIRPIAVYYLEKLGKPVPPRPKRDGEAASSAKAPAEPTAKPATAPADSAAKPATAPAEPVAKPATPPPGSAPPPAPPGGASPKKV